MQKRNPRRPLTTYTFLVGAVREPPLHGPIFIAMIRTSFECAWGAAHIYRAKPGRAPR